MWRGFAIRRKHAAAILGPLANKGQTAGLRTRKGRSVPLLVRESMGCDSGGRPHWRPPAPFGLSTHEYVSTGGEVRVSIVASSHQRDFVSPRLRARSGASAEPTKSAI